MKKRDSISGVISVIIVGLALIAYLVFSVINLARVSGIFGIREPEGLINKGEFVSVDANYINGPIYTVSHTMNGLIPMGTEYYYEIMDSENGTIYFVRASKSFEKYERSDAVIKVRGKVRKADSSMSSWMKETNDTYVEAGYRTGFVGDPVYIDNYVKTSSILSIVALLLVIVGVALIAFSSASRKDVKTFVFKDHVIVGASVIIAIAGLVLMLYTTTFIF